MCHSHFAYIDSTLLLNTAKDFVVCMCMFTVTVVCVMNCVSVF